MEDVAKIKPNTATLERTVHGQEGPADRLSDG